MNEIYTRQHKLANKTLSYDYVVNGVIVKEYEGEKEQPVLPGITRLEGSLFDFYVKGIDAEGKSSVTVNDLTITLHDFTLDKDSEYIQFNTERWASSDTINKGYRTIFLAVEITETTVLDSYRFIVCSADTNDTLQVYPFYIFVGGDYNMQSNAQDGVIFYTNGINDSDDFEQSSLVDKKVIIAITANEKVFTNTDDIKNGKLQFNDFLGKFGVLGVRINYNLYRVSAFEKCMTTDEIKATTEQIKKDLQW